ncbi:MAG: zinc ribbon domain-containing protein [Thermodesulfobacteriota bacterium]|nr:zinc ribbon domain-containing protein [Thermodesulfobacteriota bacterium]
MPIYEFYCSGCHMIFNFFSTSVNTEKRPLCPQCRKIKLDRHMSVFASPQNRGEEDMPMPDLDESKMEKAMNLLTKEAENLDENDPRQAANLMRKLTDMTGLDLGSGMEEALRRMEAGEDPEDIEAEMGDILEGDEHFGFKEKSSRSPKTSLPGVDERLYDL